MKNNEIVATELGVAGSLANVYKDPLNVFHVGIHHHPQPTPGNLDQRPMKRREARGVSAWRVTGKDSSSS